VATSIAHRTSRGKPRVTSGRNTTARPSPGYNNFGLPGLNTTSILTATVSDGQGGGAGRFLGLVANEPIYEIHWTALGGQTINTGVDNLTLGTVPAPGAILLGAPDIGLVGWQRQAESAELADGSPPRQPPSASWTLAVTPVQICGFCLTWGGRWFIDKRLFTARRKRLSPAGGETFVPVDRSGRGTW
jgi:hypothetical protein